MESRDLVRQKPLAQQAGRRFLSVARVSLVGYTRVLQVLATDEYRDWIDGLRDSTVRARILVRVERLVGGNPGSHRSLAGGISELKVDLGPGYRVYYSVRGDTLLLLLAGGDKSTQQADIARALALNRSFEG